MKNKAVVIINEQHSLMQDQIDLLNAQFDSYECLDVPTQGWTYEQMQDVTNDLYEKLLEKYDEYFVVVFASPIPALLKMVLCAFECEVNHVLVFHNDNRDKKELPNGKIIFTVTKTGWQLV